MKNRAEERPTSATSEKPELMMTDWDSSGREHLWQAGGGGGRGVQPDRPPVQWGIGRYKHSSLVHLEGGHGTSVTRFASSSSPS